MDVGGEQRAELVEGSCCYGSRDLRREPFQVGSSHAMILPERYTTAVPSAVVTEPGGEPS